MHCAYQQVVAGVRRGEGASLSCPDCEKLYKRFYLGAPGSEYSVAEHTNATGKVTSACLAGEPWFGWGCKKCVPKECKCVKAGRCCGTYVWLLPGGQEELSKLTLVILDYATNPPQPPPPAAFRPTTKEVTWYFDAAGNPTTKDQAHREVHAVVPYDQPTGFDAKVRSSAAESQIFEEAPPAVEALPAPAPFAPPNTPSIL